MHKAKKEPVTVLLLSNLTPAMLGGLQDVGHIGVVTGRDDFSRCTLSDKPLSETKSGFHDAPVLVRPHASFYIEVKSKEQVQK